MAISLRKKIVRAAAAPESVGEQLQHHMGLIAKLFDAPKLTLVIRSETLDGPIIVTNDEAHEAVNAIKQYTAVHNPQAMIKIN